MGAFVAAHGPEAVKPKHHELLHVPAQLERDLLLLSCWPTERKHQSVLQALSPIDNTLRYEKSFIGRIVAAQIRHLTNFKGHSFLIDPVSEIIEGTLAVSKSMQFHMVHLKVGDMCFIEQQCWLIQACIHHQGQFGLCGQQLEFEQTVTPHADVWTIPSATVTVVLEDSHRIRPARFWQIVDTRVLVIR